MKKKFKFGIIAALVFALCAFVFAACSGKTPGVVDADVPGYDHNTKAAFGELPDENVLIDGDLTEDMWKNLDYYEQYDTDRPGLSYKMTSHFSEKGLYVGAVSTDNRVTWGAKNYFWNNRNTQFRINIATASVTAFSTTNVKEILIDSNNVYPGNVRLNAKSKVLGGAVNSGNTQGLSVEMFITWKELGIDVSEGLPDYVQMYVRYVYVVNNSGKLSDGTFGYNPGIMYDYARYGANGYLAKDRDGAVVGDTPNGYAKSAGWDVSKEAEGRVASINTQWQGIFFKQNAATNFVMQTKIKPEGRLTTNIGSKAGLFTYTNNTYYRAICLDTDNATGGNVSGSKILTDKMFAVTHYPDSAYDLKPLVEVGTRLDYADGQEYAELKLIKKGSTFYYIVNGKLSYAETQDYMGGAVYAGLYSLYGKHVFTDYSYTNYDGNEAGIDAEIAKYAYTVNIPVTAAYKGGYVSADKIAIAKDATDRQVKLTFVSRSGYRLTDVKNNGVSIFEALKATSEGNTATISDIDGNVAITADFTEIPAENKASLHGNLRGTDGTLLDAAQIKVQALDGENNPVALYYLEGTSSSSAEYWLNLYKGFKYRLTVTCVGYHELVYTTDVINDDMVELNLVSDCNIVGGEVNNVNGVTVSSNPSAWDLSREAEGIAQIHANTPNGNTVYFTGKADTRLVAETTIRNVTNTEIYSDYEKDPAAGFRFTDGSNAIFIGLWQNGLRILPTMGEWSPIGVNGVVPYKTVNELNKDVTLKVIRVDNQFYCYIDGKHVYTYTTNVFNSAGRGVTATAVGFTFTTSYPLTMNFTNYRLDTGSDADAEIRASVYSKINVTGTGVTIGGIDSTGYAAQGAELTATASVAAGEAYIVKVAGANGVVKSYILNSGNKSVTFTALEESATNITVEKSTVVKTVSGVIKTADGKSVGKASATLTFDGGKGSMAVAIGTNGAVSAELPAGDYKLVVSLDGYNSTAIEFTVGDNAVALGDITLATGTIGGSTTVNRVTYHSQTDYFTEENGQWHAAGKLANQYSLYYNDFAAEEYAATIKTRISTKTGNAYYANDFVQGFTVVDGTRKLHIAFLGQGFRVMFGGWNTENMIETYGTGWSFLEDNMNNANGYVDIVATLVRKGSTLYVFVGGETAGAARDMKLYLIVDAKEGVIPVSVNGANHVITSGTVGRVNAMNALLEKTIATGQKNGLGYSIHMNAAVSTNVNYSMIYDAVVKTDAASIDAGLSMNIEENIGAGGSVAYSGAGYIEVDGAKKYGFGKEITITVTPDTEKKVASFKVNGKAVDYRTENGKAIATVTASGLLSVEVTFADMTYGAVLTGFSASNMNNLGSVTATDGTRTITLEYVKGDKNTVTIQIPKGAWTVTVHHKNGNTLGTATVTITGTETETPSFAIVK